MIIKALQKAYENAKVWVFRVSAQKTVESCDGMPNCCFRCETHKTKEKKRGISIIFLSLCHVTFYFKKCTQNTQMLINKNTLT